jgi:hypothetical protein
VKRHSLDEEENWHGSELSVSHMGYGSSIHDQNVSLVMYDFATPDILCCLVHGIIPDTDP